MDEIKAYCMKCKAERTMSNVSVVAMKNGRPAANGQCPVCGTKMFKFLPSTYRQQAGEPAASAESAPAEAAPVVEPTSSSDPV